MKVVNTTLVLTIVVVVVAAASIANNNNADESRCTTLARDCCWRAASSSVPWRHHAHIDQAYYRKAFRVKNTIRPPPGQPYYSTVVSNLGEYAALESCAYCAHAETSVKLWLRCWGSASTSIELCWSQLATIGGHDDNNNINNNNNVVVAHNSTRCQPLDNSKFGMIESMQIDVARNVPIYFSLIVRSRAPHATSTALVDFVQIRAEPCALKIHKLRAPPTAMPGLHITAIGGNERIQTTSNSLLDATATRSDDQTTIAATARRVPVAATRVELELSEQQQPPIIQLSQSTPIEVAPSTLLNSLDDVEPPAAQSSSSSWPSSNAPSFVAVAPPASSFSSSSSSSSTLQLLREPRRHDDAIAPTLAFAPMRRRDAAAAATAAPPADAAAAAAMWPWTSRHATTPPLVAAPPAFFAPPPVQQQQQSTIGGGWPPAAAVAFVQPTSGVAIEPPASSFGDFFAPPPSLTIPADHFAASTSSRSALVAPPPSLSSSPVRTRVDSAHYIEMPAARLAASAPSPPPPPPSPSLSRVVVAQPPSSPPPIVETPQFGTQINNRPPTIVAATTTPKPWNRENFAAFLDPRFDTAKYDELEIKFEQTNAAAAAATTTAKPRLASNSRNQLQIGRLPAGAQPRSATASTTTTTTPMPSLLLQRSRYGRPGHGVAATAAPNPLKLRPPSFARRPTAMTTTIANATWPSRLLLASTLSPRLLPSSTPSSPSSFSSASRAASITTTTTTMTTTSTTTPTTTTVATRRIDMSSFNRRGSNTHIGKVEAPPNSTIATRRTSSSSASTSCFYSGGCLFEQSTCNFENSHLLASAHGDFRRVSVGMSNFVEARLPAGGVAVYESPVNTSDGFWTLFDHLAWSPDMRFSACCRTPNRAVELSCPYESGPRETMLWINAQIYCEPDTTKLVFICENFGTRRGVCALDNVRLHAEWDAQFETPCQASQLSTL